jgi:hypothetical protein
VALSIWPAFLACQIRSSSELLPPANSQAKSQQNHGGRFRHGCHIDANGEFVLILVGSGTSVIEEKNQAG